VSAKGKLPAAADQELARADAAEKAGEPVAETAGDGAEKTGEAAAEVAGAQDGGEGRAGRTGRAGRAGGPMSSGVAGGRAKAREARIITNPSPQGCNGRK
jgi:hypothetical protein